MEDQIKEITENAGQQVKEKKYKSTKQRQE